MHRHGIVLAKPLLRSSLLALGGAALFLAPWPAAVGGAALIALAAVLAVLAVARWETTHLLISREALTVVHGLVRRERATVALQPGTVVEVERPLLGRILGYGTVVAGELEIRAVPHPERLFGR